MGIISNVEALIEVLEAMIKFVEAIDANAAQNPIVVKVQSILDELKAVGI